MTALREMLQHACYHHGNNDVRDLTPYAATGMTADEVTKLLADQPGNKEAGKTPEYLRERWIKSERFVPMTLPIEVVHPVKIPSGRTQSQTVGPIIVEDNFRDIEQIGKDGETNGFKPPTLDIDGQHRWHDAKASGQREIQALVGVNAVPKVNAAVIAAGLRERFKRQPMVDKYSRQLYQKLNGPMLFAGEWF